MKCKQPGCNVTPKLVWNEGYCHQHASTPNIGPSNVSPSQIPSLESDFRQTSFACPEQYDVYDGDNYIGYVRLRNGWFSVRDQTMRVQLVGESVDDDGIFSSDNRDYWLAVADEAIRGHWEKMSDIKNSDRIEIDSTGGVTENGTQFTVEDFGDGQFEGGMGYALRVAQSVIDDSEWDRMVVGDIDDNGLALTYRWDDEREYRYLWEVDEMGEPQRKFLHENYSMKHDVETIFEETDAPYITLCKTDPPGTPDFT